MTVAACLIVKNEGLVIARWLDSLRGLVQAVVIVDTGSTDDTLDVIRGLAHPGPIHLHQRPWKDFAHNRTELLRLAAPVADYLLILDADYTVEGHLPELTADGYALVVRTPAILYSKLVLVRSALPWRYEGVVHESLVCDQAVEPVHLETLLIRDHCDGGRRPPGWQPRWEWDAEVLEKELARDPTNTRNVFYLARSYDDLATTRPDDPRANDWRQKAMARYRQRAEMAGYADEAFYSLFRLGVLRLAEGDGLGILMEAWERCPHRWEPVHAAARWLNERRRFQASYALSKHALSVPARPSGLFVYPAVFDHLLLFEHSISAYWVGAYEESLEACQTLLGKQLPPHLEERVRSNMVFPRQRLDEQAQAAGGATPATATIPPSPAAGDTALDLAPARIPYERCPLCDSADAAEEKVGDCSGHAVYKPPLPKTQRWLRCRGCDHVYVDGYFGPAARRILFRSAQPDQTPGHDVESARYVFARIVEIVCRFLPVPGGRWLDVGFGNGALMTTAAEFGFEVVGTDLRERHVEMMRQAGYEAHAVEFEDYRPGAPFDVLSLADVLEHMPFPKHALQHARTLLRDGGLLFVSMPNSDSFVWQTLTRDGVNPYWGEIEHYHNFGRRRLYGLLRECGFEPVRYDVSFRYRACMEVLAKKSTTPTPLELRSDRGPGASG
jgi:SAM-dependent methyltransferase